jgi:hypothetical protein
MSVQTTLAALASRLESIASPQALAKVYADPREATSIGEFPCAILAQAPDVEASWHLEAAGEPGLGRHDWTAAIYLLIGARESPLPELHGRAIQWAQPIADVLLAEMTLGGVIEFLGDGQSTQLFRYRIGPIMWANIQYWGIRLWLPVTEKYQQTTGL